MSRSALPFKQRDLARAIKAAQAAGLEVARLRINRDGDIIVEIGKPREAAEAEKNEWDE
jgi:hypothetical protein